MLTINEIKALPKVELHEHLDGSLRPSTIITLAKERDIVLPEYDEEKTIESTVEIAVQINGKMRATIAIGKDDPKDQVLAKAKEAIASKLTGNIVKEIYVPGRIVNIVMK